MPRRKSLTSQLYRLARVSNKSVLPHAARALREARRAPEGVRQVDGDYPQAPQGARAL
jgi:hypothetical protein